MREYNHQDAYALINALAAEITGGQATIQAYDPSSFVSVGETILGYDHENIMNAIGILAGKRLADVRPYKSQFDAIRAENSGIFTQLKGTINYYSKVALPDGSTNNQLTTNLADGFDNGTNPTNLGVAQSTGSMWEQHTPMVAELWFAGSSTWQDALTRYENQLQNAFRNEDEFMNFWSGVLTEKQNDIETQKEAFDRMALLNYMAGIYEMSSDMPGSAINLTAEYNAEFGSTYTTEQLQTTYLVQFSEWLTGKLKDISDFMENRSENYHWAIPKTVGADTLKVLRHTPKANQKMFILKSFWNKVQARVMPEIFNDQYISFGNFTGVTFWQNENDPSAIKVKPAIPDTSDPTEQTAGSTVSLANVVGVIFDDRAVMTDYQLETVATTPLEARKLYRTTWWTFRRNAINNFSHKGVLLYMAD